MLKQSTLLAILLVVVAVCVILAHWPALTAEASSFDDQQYLHENKLVQNPGWSSTWRFLSEVLEPSSVGGYYQPLAMISLMLDYAIGGRPDNLLPFHITSLTLHVLNTSLIIVFLYMLFGSIWPAVIAGLLFGLHPMTVEPIPWVSERKTLLASFFALWCMIIYLRYAHGGSRRLLLACAAMYLLALTSKPTTVPLPLMLLLLDFWPLRRFGRAAILEKVPLFVIMLIFGILTVISQGRSAEIMMPIEYAPLRLPLILCHNIVFYLYKIVWPCNLTSHYPMPAPFNISNPTILAAVIGTCILLPVLVVSLRWTRALLTGWLFFFVGLLPTMGIIGFTNVLTSDKYAYLPSVGLLMFLVWFFKRITGYVTASFVRRCIAAVIILILTGSEFIATRRYLYHWQDSERLNRHMLSFAPNVPGARLELANAILKKGKYAEAIELYKTEIEHSTNPVNAHLNLGLAYFLQGSYDQAIEQYRNVIRIREDFGRVHFHLANALRRKRQTAEAIEHFKKALLHSPDDVQAYSNLALLLVKQGQIDEAVSYYRKSLEIKPDSVGVLNNLANALARDDRLDEAVEYWKKALSIDPDFAETYYNLGTAYLTAGDRSSALKQYRILKTLDEELANQLLNLINE